MNKLSLDNLYTSFNSEEVSNDLYKINIYITDLKNITKKNINIKEFESFLHISNNILHLIDKLFAFCRLHLYLNTNNSDATTLLKKLEIIDCNFKIVQSSFFKQFSNDFIEKFSSVSSYINEHKYYIYQQMNNSTFNIANSKYEQKYNQLISANTININNKNFPINYTRFDFSNNNDIKIYEREYFESRNNLFNNTKNEYSSLLCNIKKETIDLSSSLGYSSPLEMSLSLSGLNYTILNTLINSIEENKKIFSHYFINDLPKLTNNKIYSIQETKKIIIDSFSKFDKSLADLSNKMFDNEYIDLSNSKNKIIGSCHLKIITLKESRIIGHFNGRIKDIFQIAHELGHAYQNHLIMQSQTPLNSNVPIATCEIISMFCELLVLDHLLNTSNTKVEKQIVLKNFIDYSAQAILDVYSRFLFENELFNLISLGNNCVNGTLLDNLMSTAQKRVYNSNNKYIDKNLWIYKPHFYNIATPYYNYPYSLGILYALLLFDKYTKTEHKVFVDLFKKFCEFSGCSYFSELSLLFNIDLSDKNTFNASFSLLDDYINKLKTNS